MLVSDAFHIIMNRYEILEQELLDQIKGVNTKRKLFKTVNYNL